MYVLYALKMNSLVRYKDFKRRQYDIKMMGEIENVHFVTEICGMCQQEHRVHPFFFVIFIRDLFLLFGCSPPYHRYPTWISRVSDRIT